MQVKKEILKAIHNLTSYKNETETVRRNREDEECRLELSIIPTLFTSCSNLKSFELDNEGQGAACRVVLIKVNDVAFDAPVFLSPFYDMEDYDKSWLVEASITMQELSSIITALSNISDFYLRKRKIHSRKDYLKEDNESN